MCICTHNSNLNLLRRNFTLSLLLQGPCGFGVSWCSCSLPGMHTRSSNQIFPSILSALWNSHPLFLRSPKDPTRKLGMVTKFLFSWQQSMTPGVKSQGDGKGASALSRGKHWDGQAGGGGILSSPLVWSTEKLPVWEAAGQQMAGLQRWAVRAGSFLWLFWALIPMVERSPSLNLLRLLYALIFLQLLLKITGNLSCSLSGTPVDCLRLFLPFDTDVLGCVLPCAPDFPLYMQDTIKTFYHSCNSALTSFLIFSKKYRDLWQQPCGFRV